MAKPSAVYNTTNIVHMTTSVSQRLQIVCVLFKMIAFCVITMFAWLYVIAHVDNTYMTAIAARKMGCHVFVDFFVFHFNIYFPRYFNIKICPV